MPEPTSLRELSDGQLAERCRRGDRDAQRELYERTSERIYRLLLKLTRDPDRAFDLAQDTYVRAFTHMHQFDGQASLSTWLYRIAVNEALQFMRRAAAAQTSLRVIQKRAEAAVVEADAATKMDIEGVLAALPAEDRAVLLLRYQEGLDYAAIADITGCPVGTVGSRLNRARKRARELLRDYGTREEKPGGKHLNRDGLNERSKLAGRGVPDGGGRK
jgi:RNA polymerase sigma-70 factor (ECF subfamily)